VDLIIKIHLNAEWLKTLDKAPMIKKHLRGFVTGMLDAALIGRGKVTEIKFDDKTN